MLSACAVLSACGGGGDTPPACVPAAAVVVQMEGTSVTLGHGATDPAFTPEALLRAELVKRWPTDVSLVVTAHGGATTRDRMAGTDGYQAFPAGVVGNVYVAEWGPNDAYFGVPLAEFTANERRFAAVPGVILQTPTPMDVSKPYTADDVAYAAAVRTVAAGAGVPLIDVQAYVLAQPNWQALFVDGVHPTDALNRMLVANVIAPAVIAQVAKARCES